MTMLIRPSVVLLAAVVLGSCASPRTSKGLIDTDGDGIGETVTVLEAAGSQEVVRLHLQKIDVSRKLLELAENDLAITKVHFGAGRVGADGLLATQTRVASAKVALIDARLALARTGMLAVEEMTMLDSDEDGLPDTLVQPVDPGQLLDQKLALREEILDHGKQGFAQIEALYESGRASDQDLGKAARVMHEAELALLDARMERESLR